MEQEGGGGGGGGSLGMLGGENFVVKLVWDWVGVALAIDNFDIHLTLYLIIFIILSIIKNPYSMHKTSTSWFY